MRIRDIYIDGFGQFAGKEFGPLEQPVTVFFGPNEAGKSTLLEFIRTVLFGFRPRASNYPPLAGGRHGGRVTLINRDGHVSVVNRFKGGRLGKVTLESETGALQDETMLAQILGNNSRDVFEQVFAFTLDELHSSDLLTDANVNNQIYSAGMGVTSLPNVIKSIGSERATLFLKQGRSQKIYNAYKELQDLDEKLRTIEVNAARYGDLITRLQQVETELEGLAACRRRIQSRHAHQIRLQSAWDAWNDLISTQQELDSLPVIDNFPTGGISRLETLEERVRIARREYASAEARVAEAEREAEIRVDHEAILKHSSDIRHLQKARTAFDGSVKDLPEREAELRGHERTLAATLRDLGQDWDEVRLAGFDFSLAVRQEIAEHRDRLRIAFDAHSSHRSSLSQNETAVKEASDAEGKANNVFQSSIEPSLDAEQIRLRRNLIRTLKSRIDEFSRLRQNVLNLQSQLDGLESTELPPGGADRSRTVAAVSLIIGIGLLVGGAVLGEMALIIGIVAGTALTGVAIYLFMSGKPGLVDAGESPLAASVRESHRRADAVMQSLQSKMKHEAVPLGLEEIDESSILAEEESIDEEEHRLQGWTRLSEALDHAKELTNRRRTRLEESVAAFEDAERQLVSAQREWQHWLEVRGLLDTFTPETADVLQTQIELGRSRLGDVRSWQQRIEAIEKDIDEYIEAVEPFALCYDVTFDRSNGRMVASAADRLIELLEEVQERVRKRADAEAEMEDAKRRLEERRGELQSVEEELKRLFKSGGVEEAEDFRVRAGLSEGRAELDKRARAALDRLQRLSGPGKPLESLKADLGSTNLQSITDEIASLEEERANVDTQHGDLSTGRGSIQTELNSLSGEEESSRLRMERNVLLEQIKGHARDWTRLTLAQNLLTEARRKFEQERQPGVVRHAQRAFAAITEDRYRQVYAPLGEQTITVTDADGRRKQPSELSRGTREQLFLSLRFGLIRELGQLTEPLPVIVDEVLVNFDPDRALQAAVAFTKLSATNQVLVFTCHPTIVELFRDASSAAGTEKLSVVSIN